MEKRSSQCIHFTRSWKDWQVRISKTVNDLGPCRKAPTLSGTLRESIATPEDLYAQPACCPADIPSADPEQATETSPLLFIRAQPRPMYGDSSVLNS